MSGERTLLFMNQVADANNSPAGKAYIHDVIGRAKHDLSGDSKYGALSSEQQGIAMALTMARHVLKDLANPKPPGLLTSYNSAHPIEARSFFQSAVDLVADANRIQKAKAV